MDLINDLYDQALKGKVWNTDPNVALHHQNRDKILIEFRQIDALQTKKDLYRRLR